MIREYRAMFRAVAEKRLHILRRYWINTAGGLVVTYLLFVMVFFGGRAAAPDAMGEALPSIIVGFFVWSMAFGAFQAPAQMLVEESQWGTLEQLYMSPISLGAFLAAESVFTILVSLGLGLALLVLMMVTTGQYLAVDLLTVIPFSIATICTVIGLGLAFGGFALVHKRVEGLFNVIQILFLGILGLSSSSILVDLLPLKLGFEMLIGSMESGRRLWEFPAAELLALVVIAGGYLAVGGVVLRHYLRVARSRSLMADY
jgi:ABC-2 type transport system permease protein